MDLEIGGFEVKGGEKRSLGLRVSIEADGTPLEIPVLAAAGRGEGPIICVDACHHGDEYEGAEAVLRLWEGLDPGELNGAFLGVPVVNPPAFLAGTRGNLRDFDTGHLDANRVYPGRDGCITERLVKAYFEGIVKKSDRVISFHGGGNRWLVGPIAIYQPEGSKTHAESLSMAKAFGVRLLCPTPAGLEGTLLHATAEEGIPAIAAEIGGHCDRYSNRGSYVGVGVEGVRNVMRRLGILEGPARETDHVFLEARYIHCANGGLFSPKAKVGDRVEEGDELGLIENPWTGEVIESIRAPFGGIVWLVTCYPLANPGDWVFGLGREIAEPR